MEDLEGDRIYSAWGWVLLDVTAVLEVKADIKLPFYCESGISGTQISESLSNHMYDVLNHAVLYLTASWGDGPCPVLL